MEKERRQQVLLMDLGDILNRVDELPVVDERTPDEILGYDDRGLPF